MPVAKETDAEVFAGTINGDGALEIESTKAAEDTTLARIIRMVQEAHGRRAQVEQWVEKFAAVYTPAVIAVALAIFLVPPLAFGAAWAERSEERRVGKEGVSQCGSRGSPYH